MSDAAHPWNLAPRTSVAVPGNASAGFFGAVAAVTSFQRAQETGVGELLDVSLLEVLVLTMNMYRSPAAPWRRRPEPSSARAGDAM
jgi:crotonobetainyl-CoA:carnitine CoA-transferase CaiB-like acyl-CoA transferase